MELIAGGIVEEFGPGSFRHAAEQAIEESLEMVGAIVLLYAILDHMRRFVGPVTMRITGTGNS